MAYDEQLADNVRILLVARPGYSEKKMFGGLCFLINGNMCCGINDSKLMLRVGSENYPKLLKKEYVKPMDFTGRPLKGMVYILPTGLRTVSSINKWVQISLDFVNTLPKKIKKQK